MAEQQLNEQEQKALEAKEAAAGFAKGFERVSGATSSDGGDADAEAAAAAKTKADADAAVQAETKAKADAEVKAKADADAKIKAEADRTKFLETLPTRLRNIEGHLGGLNSKLDSALATAKAAATAAGKEAPTQAQITAASASTERWKKLEGDFPEWTAALNERLAAMTADFAGKLPKAVDVSGIKRDVVGSMVPLIEAAKSEGRNLALVDFKHEGWEQKVKTKEFKSWLALQTTEIQALTDSEKAADAIKLLDNYNVHTTAAAKAEEDRVKQEKRLAGAITPKGAGAAVVQAGVSDEEAFNRGFKRVAKAK